MGWVIRRFSIAEVLFELEVPEGPPFSELLEGWAPFGTEERAEIRIRVDSAGEGPPTVDGPRGLPEVEVDRSGALRIAGEGFTAEADRGRKAALVRQTWADRFPVETLVKVLVAERLLGQSGLLVHGVGISQKGRAAIFVGPSGAGKSTLGELCTAAGLTCLSDELVGIRPASKEVLAFGTPWNVGVPSSACVKLVGALAFARGSRLLPLPTAELARLILPNALMPDPSPGGRKRMFHNLSGLLERVATATFEFAPEPSAAGALGVALEEGE